MRHDAKFNDDYLVDLVYSALLGETTWQVFLDRLSDTLPNCKSSMFFYDPNQNVGSFSITSGMDSSSITRFDSHYSRINPLMKKATLRPVGLGTVAEQMCPRDEFVKTEFYNDFFRAMDTETAVGLTIMRENGCCFFLTNITKRSDANENRGSADRLTRLSPHLKRAFNFYRNRSEKTAADIGGSLFDALNVGVLIIGEWSAVKASSAMGQSMLDRGDVVGLTPIGRLRLRDRGVNDLLVGMLGRHFSGPKVVAATIGATKLSLIRLEKDRVSEFFEGPTVVLLLEPIQSGGRKIRVSDFAKLHGLTKAEVRVLSGVVSGQSIAEIAECVSVTRETIRTQLKALYAKTGTSRQVDLIRLAAGLGDVLHD